MMKTGNTVFNVKSLDIKNDLESFVPVGALNSIRREVLDELYDKLIKSYHRLNDSDTDSIYEKKTGELSFYDVSKKHLPVFSISNARQLKAFMDAGPLGMIRADIFSDVYRRYSKTNGIFKS